MRWYSIDVSCAASIADIVADALESLGAKGTVVHDAMGEARAVGRIEEGVVPLVFCTDLPSDRRLTISGYYPELFYDFEKLLKDLRGMLAERVSAFEQSGLWAGAYSIETKSHDDAEWESAWKAGFKSMNVGEKLIIAPPWDLSRTNDRTLIVIDPGMAFGTGTHPTTRMCLELLEQHVKPGHLVVDVGTGSGILAVCAAKLGATRVWAWDGDPASVEAAIQNVADNRVTDIVRVLLHESKATDRAVPEAAESARANCDVVVANIAADPVVSLAGALASLLRPGGVAVLSGIIVEKESMCRAEYLSRGFAACGRLVDGDWVALCFQKEQD